MESTHLTPIPTVRRAHYAGTWYPGRAAELRLSVSGYLAQATPQALPGKPIALVCPHPGHMFGGQVAASAFAQVRGMGFKRVVLLGPLHRPIPGSVIGDCMAPRNVMAATAEGHTAGHTV